MATGTVKWFSEPKGFGYILPDDGTADVFVHFSAVEASGLSTLTKDQRVSYELGEVPRSRMTGAVELKLLEPLTPEEKLTRASSVPPTPPASGSPPASA